LARHALQALSEIVLYTSHIIGLDLASARFILSLTFGIGIGMIMALVFSRDDAVYDGATDAVVAGQDAKGMHIPALILLLVLVAILLAGTLKIRTAGIRRRGPRSSHGPPRQRGRSSPQRAEFEPGIARPHHRRLGREDASRFR
jgi:hypothetical protein